MSGIEKGEDLWTSYIRMKAASDARKAAIRKTWEPERVSFWTPEELADIRQRARARVEKIMERHKRLGLSELWEDSLALISRIRTQVGTPLVENLESQWDASSSPESLDLKGISSMKWQKLTGDLRVEVDKENIELLWVWFFNSIELWERSDNIYTLDELRKLVIEHGKKPHDKLLYFYSAIRLKFCDTWDDRFYHQGNRIFLWENGKSMSLADFIKDLASFKQSTYIAS